MCTSYLTQTCIESLYFFHDSLKCWMSVYFKSKEANVLLLPVVKMSDWFPKNDLKHMQQSFSVLNRSRSMQ